MHGSRPPLRTSHPPALPEGQPQQREGVTAKSSHAFQRSFSGAIVNLDMDTILKIAVVILICGGGSIAIAIGLQLLARRGPRKNV